MAASRHGSTTCKLRRDRTEPRQDQKPASWLQEASKQEGKTRGDPTEVDPGERECYGRNRSRFNSGRRSDSVTSTKIDLSTYET